MLYQSVPFKLKFILLTWIMHQYWSYLWKKSLTEIKHPDGIGWLVVLCGYWALCSVIVYYSLHADQLSLICFY